MKYALFLAPILMAATCGVGPVDWYQTGTLNKPHDTVFNTAKELLEKDPKYSFKLEKCDPSSGVIHTHWKEQLSPHWREGKRIKVEVEILRAKDSVNVRVRTFKEFNDNSRTPMSSKDADWTAEGGENDLSARIAWQLINRLKGHSLDD